MKGNEENVVELLDNEEAMEFAKFVPTVTNNHLECWGSIEAVNAFLEKHLSQEVTAGMLHVL